MISHEGMITPSQDVPSMFLPLHVTVDPQGLIDTGLEGHLECEEQRQLEQAIIESQVVNIPQDEEVKHDELSAANPYPSLGKGHNQGESIPGIPVEEPEIHN